MNRFHECLCGEPHESSLNSYNGKISGEYITRNFTHKDLETLILHKVGGRRLYEIRSFPQTIPEYRAEPFHSTDEIEQFLVNEIFSNLMNELDIYGIFSMTESRENLLMWSHYAEDHKGMVVGFERSHQFFNCLGNTLHQVKYCDRRLAITSNDGIIRIAGKENEIPLRLLSRKHTSWSHEKEWRVIRKLNESNRSSKEVFLFEIPSSAIRTITLGAQMSPEDTKNICEKIANNSKWSHITVYKAKLSEQKSGIVPHFP